jgi:tetratricopeptide (TPR) repeat protein
VRRREFLPLVVAAAVDEAQAAPLDIQYRRRPGYFAWRQRIENGADEFGVLPMPEPVKETPPPAEPWFAEITGIVLESEQLSRGIPYWIARLDAASGIDTYGNNGVAVGDIDNDGIDEIYVCQPAGLPNRLFRWRDGRLLDVSAEAGVDLLDDTSCALFLDIRNLGRQDLIVLRGAGPVLFLNDGAGKFTLAPDAFRFVSPPRGAFTGMAAADYDRDGKLDVYCCCYSFFQSEAQFLYPTPYHDAENGPPNFLFRNRLSTDGSGFFEDVTAAVGLDENNRRYSFAPAWCDYNGSGWPSLYVANDFGRNNLYKNTGGRFRDVAADAGVEDIGPGMSACWFDEDGDGRPDLYVGNMWTAAGQAVIRSPEFRKRYPESLGEAWRRHTKGNSLYTNRGEGRFEETGADRGIEMGRWAWSCDAADFDNDGRPEVFITCGMLTGSKQPDLMGFFWRQVVARSPVDPTPASPYEEGWNALNQFIREGYSWNGSEPNVFYRRDDEKYRDASLESGLGFAGDSRAFAVTDFDGDGCLDLVVKNRLAPQLRVFQNRCGQARHRIGIRLIGTESNRDSVGAKVKVGHQTKWVAAGSGYLSQHTKTLYFGLPDNEASIRVEITWPSGKAQPVERLHPNRLYEITEGGGHRLLRVFANRTPVRPGRARGDNESRLHDTWLVDPVPLPEKQTGPGLLVLHEADLRQRLEAAAAYTLFRRYLFEYRADLELPLALLLDRNGHAVKIYSAVPTDAQVKEDLKLAGHRPALPYAGRALSQPGRDYFKLGAALLWSGYAEQALPYLELVLRRNPDNTRTMVLVAQIHREAGRLQPAATWIDEALRRDATLPEAWNERGGIALTQNRPAEALQHFEQALAVKPDLLYALLNAAQTASQLNRLDLAETYYRRARSAHPKSAEPANGLGLLLAKAGKDRDAERLLREATTTDPTLATGWNNLAVLYLRSGRQRDAIATLEQGIRHNRADEALYLNLGRIYVQGGDRQQARAVMQKLLVERPDSAVAQKAVRDLEALK